VAQLSYLATWYLSAGVVPERRSLSAHPSIVPFQFFATADGYIAVACAKEKFFADLITLMELPEAANARFASFDGRRMHREELVALLSRRFAEHPTEVWMERLAGRIPCAPVRTVPAALDQAELEARDMLATYESPLLGPVRSVGLPVTFSDFRPDYRAAPLLGGDSLGVLADAGFLPDQIRELQRAGAFGRDPEETRESD
jgi:crotonobetainyl-CoA:carnitine CoA-transferase CaiB-like acyl-CoA transferase